MYGMEAIKVKDVDVIISSKERTLIDLIYFNKPVGGIAAAVEIVKQIARERKCDIKKLVEYASRFPNITTRKRMGLLLESVGISGVILRQLIKSVEKTAVSSLDGSRKGKLDKRWRVIVNGSRK